MKFHFMGVYRHRNCLDVDIFVHKVKAVNDVGTQLSISWIYRNGQGCAGSEDIIVTRAQYDNWSEIK